MTKPHGVAYDWEQDPTAIRDGLFVTDAEIIHRLGVPVKHATDALRVLDHECKRNRFPQKQKLWGDRRYWPAVKQWLDANNGLRIPSNRREEDAA
jgi:hypothetical protein